MTEKRDKVNVDDIIGLIKTDKPIDSVEEVRKLRGRETKQYEYNVNKNQIEKNGYYFALCNIVDAQKIVRELNEKDRQIKVGKFRVNALADENEQLKSIIKEVTELLSDEVDLFSDKATEHDINAYIELGKLDNKDAYYMAVATKKAIKMLKELEE